MNNSLVKLVDASLLPAALMVVGKFVGLVVTIGLFNLPWTVKELPDSLFSIRPGFLAEDLTIASSYSDLVMYLILAIGFSFILVQATYLHDTHIKPSMLVRLSNHNLMGLVKSSFDIYHRAAIWTIIIWLANILIWANVATGRTYIWIGLVTLISNIIFTTFLLQDVYQEIEMSKRNIGRQEALL